MYFFGVYVAAEVLALPAVPLTASAGYLFGVAPGTAVVLLAAAVAASVSFLIGRTIGRDWILQVASGNDRFRALDSVISQEGFKIVLLLRLSPLFPFALSNYLYGLTSVPFWDYFWGTLLGCARRARARAPARDARPWRERREKLRARATPRPLATRAQLRAGHDGLRVHGHGGQGPARRRRRRAALVRIRRRARRARHPHARADRYLDQGGRGDRGRREGKAGSTAQIAEVKVDGGATPPPVVCDPNEEPAPTPAPRVGFYALVRTL